MEYSEPYEMGMEQPSNSSSSWIWILLLVLALLVIIGLVIWVVFLYRRKTGDKVSNLTLGGANICANDPTGTSITGTWTTTTNTNDVVTLSATTQPPVFKVNGDVTNPVGTPTPNTSGIKSINLTGLTPNYKYYANLVVTNPSSPNSFYVYTQLIYTATTPAASTTTSPNTFSIEHILQVGKIQDVALGTVNFVQNPSDASSLWEFNPDGVKKQIVNKTTGRFLYSDANGILKSGDSTTDISDANSQWTYTCNQWCLLNPPTTGTQSCMTLGPITSGSASINLTATGDEWVNAFESA